MLEIPQRLSAQLRWKQRKPQETALRSEHRRLRLKANQCLLLTSVLELAPPRGRPLEAALMDEFQVDVGIAGERLLSGRMDGI